MVGPCIGCFILGGCVGLLVASCLAAAHEEPAPAPKVETNIYDKATVYENCTVEVWENTVTGATSWGWWENE